MPNSLVPDFPVTTAQAPRPGLSGNEIAAPFRDFANVLDKTGAALTDISETAADRAGEEAGRKSVRTADDGSLVVDDTRNPFIVGPAAARYERAAKLTQLAQIQPQVETDVLKLRLAHPNDPDQFQSAAKGYAESLLPGISDPHMRGAVSDFVNTNTQHNLRTVLSDADRANTTEALQTYQARIKDLNEQMSSLARQGGTGTPEYLAMAHDRATFWNNLQADPRFKFSKERADLETNEAWSNDKIQEKIGQVQRDYMQDRDLPKAKLALQQAFWGEGSEKLNLTAAKRDHGVAEGIHAITNLSALDHEAIAENRNATSKWMTATVTAPRQFDMGQALNLRQHSHDIGDARSEHEIEETIKFQPLAQAYHSASPQGRSEMLAEIRRGVVPAYRLQSGFQSMLDAAPPEIAKDISVFSGMRTPEHQADLFRAAVQKYGSEEEARKWVAPPGHSQHEKGNAADLRFGSDEARQWAHDNAGKYGLTFPLANEPWHIETADARTAGKVGALQEGQQVDLGAASPTARLFETVTKDLSGLVSKDAEKAFTRIEKNASEGTTVLPDDIQHFAEMASRAGRDDLIEKARPWLSALDVNAGRPEGQTTDILKGQIAELRAKGIDPMAADTLDHVEAISKAQDERFAQNPRAEAAGRGWVGSPGQLALDNPAAFGAEIAQREKNTGVIQQHVPNIGPLPAIMPAEAERFATVLTKGDPQVASQLLGQLQTNLSPDNWRATMNSEPVKAGMISMFSTDNPVKLDAAGDTLYKLWSTNPQDFHRVYGEQMLDRVLAWKGLEGVSAGKRTEILGKADDPELAKQRIEVGKAIDKQMEGLSAQNALDLMGTYREQVARRQAGLVHNPLYIANTNPSVGDEIQQGIFTSEFRDNVKALRMYGVSQPNAIQLATARMNSTWSKTELIDPDRAGGGYRGVLMKYAPEPYYPQVDGSHDWMKRDMEGLVSKWYGPKMATISLEGGSTVIPGWYVAGVFADPQTEREVKKFNPAKPVGPDNQPPSYRIHIVDQNGQHQIARDPNTGNDRIRWDPASAQGTYRAKQAGVFDRAGQRIDLMNTPGAGMQ